MIYLVTGILGLAFALMGQLFAMTGGEESGYLHGALLALAYAGVLFYALRQAKRGRRTRAAVALLSPMFLVSGALVLVHFGLRAWEALRPDPADFVAACRNAGPHYASLPDAPVRSIAYDWNTEPAPPFNDVTVAFGTRITRLAYADGPHPGGIDYVERKRSSREGRPAAGPDGPYLRFPRNGAYHGVPELSADVLVRYTLHPERELQKAEPDQGMVHYALTVTDRRTGRQLATLRYVIDASRGRACGLTEEDRINERAFVLKAIGRAPPGY